MTWEVIHGDSLVVVPQLGLRPENVAIITDNPYGMNNNADYSRFTGGAKPSNTFANIAGDDEPFDPSYWLQFPYVTLWGYQFIAPRLPVGTVLFWDKKPEGQIKPYLSDGELGWQKGGYGVYEFKHVWQGFLRESERGETLHPNQKPVALMRWCIERQNLPKGTIVVDPYCGSGSTLLAARELGFDCIGIDVDSYNCDMARARLTRASGAYAEMPARRNVKDRATPLLDLLTA